MCSSSSHAVYVCICLCAHVRVELHAHLHQICKCVHVSLCESQTLHCIFDYVCDCRRQREAERGTIMLLMMAPDAEKRRSVKKLSMLPIWKASLLNEVVQNHPIDNKANFYGSDKYVIMFSGAFQILSQSINHTGNFPSPI